MKYIFEDKYDIDRSENTTSCKVNVIPMLRSAQDAVTSFLTRRKNGKQRILRTRRVEDNRTE